MTPKHFEGHLPRERTALRAAGVFYVLAILTAATLLLVNIRTRLPALLAVTLLSLLIATLTVLYLRRLYLSLHLVREKRQIQAEASGLQARVSTLDSQLKETQRTHANLPAEKETAVQKRQAAYHTHVADLDRRRTALPRREQEETAAGLLRLQNDYVLTGLAATPIKTAKIPDIGAKSKQRLAEHGILTAADVSKARILPIDSLGQSRATTLADWRKRREAELRATQPTELPLELRASIQRKYHQLAIQLGQETDDEAATLAADLAAIERASQERKTELDALEADLRQQRTALEQASAELAARLAEYRDINPAAYADRCLQAATGSAARPRALAGAVLAFLFVAGTLLPGLAGIVALTRSPVVTPETPTSTAALPATERADLLAKQPPPLLATSTLTPTLSATPTSTRTATPTPTPTATPTPTSTPTRTEATVTRIVDGDTIHVSIAGQDYPLRYIGIDSPEPNDPFGTAATEANAKLVEGRIVYLEQDVSDTDQYGRLLRYVYLADGAFVNAELVRQGYASAKEYPPDTKYRDLFSASQQQAQQATRGLWAPTPIPSPSSTRAPTPPPTKIPAATTAPTVGRVEITYILYDGAVYRVESDEYAEVTNTGGSPVNLSAWRLNAGNPGQDFTFPDFTLEPGQSCRVYTNEYNPQTCGFSFGSGSAIWNNKGDCGHLYDPTGAEVSIFCY